MKNNKWAGLLAYVSGMINQQLLLQNEYLIAENRILRAHLPTRLSLSNPQKSTLAEIGKRLGRKALEPVVCVAKPDYETCLVPQARHMEIRWFKTTPASGSLRAQKLAFRPRIWEPIVQRGIGGVNGSPTIFLSHAQPSLLDRITMRFLAGTCSPPDFSPKGSLWDPLRKVANGVRAGRPIGPAASAFAFATIRTRKFGVEPLTSDSFQPPQN